MSNRSTLRRAFRLVADGGSVAPDVRSHAIALVQEDLRAEGVVRRLAALKRDHLLAAAAAPECGAAVLRRLLQHLDEHAGAVSLDRFVDLSRAAVVIAARLNPAAPALRARAHQKLGTALARKGLLRDADCELSLAEEIADETSAPQFYKALARFAKAAAAAQMKRGDVAARLLPGIADTFSRYCDEKRARQTRELHAIILQHDERLPEALAEYLALEPLVRQHGSAYERAILEGNIATCLVDMGHLHAANDYAARAIPVLQRLGQIVAVLRIERVLARRVTADAPERLANIASQFMSAGAVGEYVLTMIEVVMARLPVVHDTVDADIEALVRCAITCGLENYVVAELRELEAAAARRSLDAENLARTLRALRPRLADVKTADVLLNVRKIRDIR